MVFNKDSEQVVATLKGHQKKVTHVIHHFDEVCIDIVCIENLIMVFYRILL